MRGTQALVSFAPLAFKLFYAARQNAVLRRSPFPLAAGATIPSDTTDAYLCKVLVAGGFKAYKKAHRQALVALAAKCFPRLPTEVAAQVVAFAFHVGYY